MPTACPARDVFLAGGALYLVGVELTSERTPNAIPHEKDHL
jgi:hypothetical protein